MDLRLPAGLTSRSSFCNAVLINIVEMVRVSALIGAVALATAATAAAVDSKASKTSCATPLPTVDLGYGRWSAKINVGYFAPLSTARGSLCVFL